MVAAGAREKARWSRQGRAARSRTGVRAVKARQGHGRGVMRLRRCRVRGRGRGHGRGVVRLRRGAFEVAARCGAVRAVEVRRGAFEVTVRFAGAESRGQGCGAVQSSVRRRIQTGGRGGGKGVRVAESGCEKEWERK